MPGESGLYFPRALCRQPSLCGLALAPQAVPDQQTGNSVAQKVGDYNTENNKMRF